MRNNLWGKFLRTFTSMLPVSGNRTGRCRRCGACCKLPNICPFLKLKDGKISCSVHFFRPPELQEISKDWQRAHHSKELRIQVQGTA